MTPSPTPVEPVVSSQDALWPRPSRALLNEMAAMKAARLLHHGLVETITGRVGFVGVLGGRIGYYARCFGREGGLSSMKME